jgi:ligand-binding sensor domain-containing protein
MIDKLFHLFSVKRLTSLIAVGVLFISSAFSQTYNFKTYTVEDGLSRAEILSVWQDSKGVMWFGTAGGGVSKFNGKTFENISTRNGLVNNDVNYIYEDRAGDLWFATNGGLSKYKNHQFTNYTVANGLADNTIASVLEDKAGNIWMRTQQHGISIINANNKKIKNYTTKNGLPDNLVYDIKEDKQGNMWLPCFKGLAKVRLDENNKLAITTYTTEKGLKNNQVSSVLIGSNGDVYIGSWGGGLSKYIGDKGSKCFENYSAAGGNGDLVLCIAEDIQHQVFAGTLGGGLNKLIGKNLKNYSSGQFLPRDFITKIYLDSKSNLWLITSDEHLVKFNQNNKQSYFTSYSSSNGLSDERVKMIFEDREGNIWIATAKGGICRYSGDAISYITTKDGLSNNVVQAVSLDGQGNLLFGTDGGGVSHLHAIDQGFINTTYDLKNGYSNFINVIYKDSKGNNWIGSNDYGLYMLSPSGNKLNFNKSKGLPSDKVLAVFEDKDKMIWVGTQSGIAKYNASAQLFTKVDDKSYSAEYIQQDGDGGIWYTSAETHLCRIDKNGTAVFNAPYILSGTILWNENAQTILLGTEADGLITCKLEKNTIVYKTLISAPELNYAGVNSLINDDKGNVWIGTTNGIIRFDYANYTKSGVRLIKHFDKADGLISVVCNKNAIFKDKNTLWFGTVNGAASLNTGMMLLNAKPPIVSVTNLRLFYENTDWRKYADSIDVSTGLPLGLVLPYNFNHITFDFIGLSLTVPEKVKYKYMLKGLEQNWSPVRSENFATYPNLAPGTYTFMLLACNNDGVWSEKPNTYSFVITAPFYKRGWFILLTIIVIAAVIYAVYWWRVQQIRKTASLKQLIVESEQKALRAQMNPHFIFNSLNSIQFFITDKDVKSANKYLSKFSKLMRLTLDNSKKTLISLHEEIEALTLYMELESLRFEGKFEYVIETDDDIDKYGIEIPPMLLQPYIENAIWHGITHKNTKGIITVRMMMEDDDILRCEIEDNGIGRKKSAEMKIEHPATHNSSGMTITKDRLDSISKLKKSKGRVEVIDLEDNMGNGEGTKVVLYIPVE